MNVPRLTAQNRLALLMHDALRQPYGKMGFGLMRYSVAPVVVVIDRTQVGKSLHALTGIACNAPIVGSVQEALAYQPDTLVPAIAPPGGALPSDWWKEIKAGVAAGLSLVNGLHRPLADDPELTSLLRPGRFIWDIRQPPTNLQNGAGRAREVPALRVLIVGTDMSNGKMTAAIELDRAARARGMRSRFLATGQTGIVIAGEGVALDAVRVDFAAGAVETMILQYGYDHEILFIEGQGSLLHPASTAPLALLRGAMPTHLILVHRAGQSSLRRCPWVPIPSLRRVITLHEAVSAASGSLPRAHVVGIALNCAHLSDEESSCAVEEIARETGLPTTDVIRFGADILVDAIVKAAGRLGSCGAHNKGGSPAAHPL
jgi:uncharacterized NAD-dependent epimerase/dehydratase family protein